MFQNKSQSFLTSHPVGHDLVLWRILKDRDERRRKDVDLELLHRQ